MGTQLDASEVLAAALEQMDGIIAGTKLDFSDGINDNHSCTFRTKLQENQPRTISSLLKELRVAVECCMKSDANDNIGTKDAIDPETKYFLFRWLQQTLPEEYLKLPGFDDCPQILDWIKIKRIAGPLEHSCFAFLRKLLSLF